MAKRKGRHREVMFEGSVEQTHEPMCKHRIKRHTVPDELAADNEVHIHQGHSL